MDVLSTAAQTYMQTFGDDISQFLKWGQWLFFGLLSINLVLMFFWYAFDRESFVGSTAKFIRKFFVIAIFYTIMLNHQWLLEALKSAEIMGKTLTGAPTDPSSIISQGIGIANKVIFPVQSEGLLTIGFGALVILITYVVILFAFISIAIQLAVTMIITTALIVASTFFLGFSALSATSQIARNTLDVVLANCVKLLGIYLVVAAGSKTITALENYIPTQVGSFDIYSWLLATVFLFWLMVKNLPEQFARIVSNAINETRGHEVASLAMAATQLASSATALNGVLAVAGGIAKGGIKAGSGAISGAAGAYSQARTEGLSKSMAAMKGAAGGFSGAKNSLSSVSQHYGQLSRKANNSSKGSPSVGQAGGSNSVGNASTENNKGVSGFSSVIDKKNP